MIGTPVTFPLTFKEYIDQLDVKDTLQTLQKSALLRTARNLMSVSGPCCDLTGSIFTDTQETCARSALIYSK